MRELTLDKLPKRVLSSLDLESVFIASRCVIAAERLLIFRQFQGRQLTARALGKRLGIESTHLVSLLDLMAFLGLLTKVGKSYALTRMAEKHFIRARSIDWTEFWSRECAQDYDDLTVLEKVLTTGKDWRDFLDQERRADYELSRDDPEWARRFTLALYDNYKSDAELLAANLDLTSFRNLLDVGGGSGVMSIALARSHPHLMACVMDFKYVCDAAEEVIRGNRMSRRVTTLAGDMYESIPAGFDIIMFWNIGSIETRVMKMAYESLPHGGMLIRSCPPPISTHTLSPQGFLKRFTGVRPHSQSRESIRASMQAAGFQKTAYRTIKKQLHYLVGRK